MDTARDWKLKRLEELLLDDPYKYEFYSRLDDRIN